MCCSLDVYDNVIYVLFDRSKFKGYVHTGINSKTSNTYNICLGDKIFCRCDTSIPFPSRRTSLSFMLT